MVQRRTLGQPAPLTVPMTNLVAMPLLFEYLGVTDLTIASAGTHLELLDLQEFAGVVETVMVCGLPVLRE